MAVDSISAGVISPQAYGAFAKNQQKINNPVVTQNTLERSSQNDKFEKKGIGVGAKVAIGTVIATTIFALGDVAFNRGRLLKKFFGKPDKQPCSPKLNEEGQKLYEAYKAKLDGRININVNDAKSKELTELANFYKTSSKVARNNAIKDGNILEYVIKDEGNVIRVKNGKIVSYKNANGEDLLYTFDDVVSMQRKFTDELNRLKNSKPDQNEYYIELDKLKEKYEKLINKDDEAYLSKINNIISDVKGKNKTALAKLDEVVIEDYASVVSADDIALYVKNKNMPYDRKFGDIYMIDGQACFYKSKDGLVRSVIRDEYIVRKTEHNLPEAANPSSIARTRKHEIPETEHVYKYVNHRKDGTVEVLQRCDGKGNILTPSEVKNKAHYNEEHLWLRQVRETQNKGRVIENSIGEYAFGEFEPLK